MPKSISGRIISKAEQRRRAGELTLEQYGEELRKEVAIDVEEMIREAKEAAKRDPLGWIFLPR